MSVSRTILFVAFLLAIGGCPPPAEITTDGGADGVNLPDLPDLPDDELFDMFFTEENPEEVEVFTNNGADSLDLDTDAFDFGTVDVKRPLLQVQDPNGGPISTALVRVISGTPEEPIGELLFRGQTDENGQSQLDLLVLRSQPNSTIIVEKPFFETATFVLNGDDDAPTISVVLELDVEEPDVPPIDEIFGVVDDENQSAFSAAKLAARQKTGTHLEVRPRMSLPTSLLNEIKGLLPERNPLPSRRPQFVDSSINPNIELDEEAEVSVTFIDEGAGYRNAFGYFLYDDDGNVLEATPIWKNASERGGGGRLMPGDTVSLGTFPAGTNIGFYLIANGFSRRAAVPANSHPVYVFYSLDSLNPAKDRHVAMIVANTLVDGRRPIVVGWEDLVIGRGDDDYNDLSYLININPTSVIDQLIEDGIPESDVRVDTDGDGVSDEDDDFPEDDERAFRVRVPADGRNFNIAFEDNFPNVGDGDYNDVVVSFYANRVTNAAGRVKDLELTHLIQARGASFKHEMHHRIRFADVVPIVAEVETFDQNWESTGVTSEGYTGEADLVIFADTHAALSDENSILPNTEPDVDQVRGSYTRTKLTFSPSFPVLAIEPLPADPYLQVLDTGFDIHLIGQSPINDSKNPASSGDVSFLDDNGFPFALLVPNNWNYPQAGNFIETTFPDFRSWRESGGEEQSDWFDRPGEGARDVEFEVP